MPLESILKKHADVRRMCRWGEWEDMMTHVGAFSDFSDPGWDTWDPCRNTGEIWKNEGKE